jgi:RNA polymerase sigma-70 factor, ECF subfamily
LNSKRYWRSWCSKPLAEGSMNVDLPASTDSDDTDLIIAVQARDRSAFGRLYLSYHPRLTAFLAQVTTRRENVEEIIHDTFMNIWAFAKEGQRESKASIWIMEIAFRSAMRKLRRQDVPSLSSVNDLVQNADRAQDAGAKDWLRCGLSRLPVEQRITLMLAYQMGYSVEEIARITRSSVDTVKSRMLHARVGLRRHAKRPILR